MAKTYGFTKTKIIKLETDDALDKQLKQTTAVYQHVFAFYADLVESHKALTEGNWLGQFEALTHVTKSNPTPKFPLTDIAIKYPSGFRRAALSDAVGSYQSWSTRYDQWQNRKVKQDERNTKRVQRGKPALPFTEKPPFYQRDCDVWTTYYDTEWSLVDEHHVLLKAVTENSYAKRKIKTNRPIRVPNGYVFGSPTLIHKRSGWFLHIPFILPKKGMTFGTAKERLKQTDGRFCLVDLGMNHHAVCTIQDAKGRVYGTLFISAEKDNHLRKRLLDRIVNKQIQSGIAPEDEFFCRKLWNKISRMNDNIAHQVSAQIVTFAAQHGANTIVFEHLGNLGPQRGKRSRRLNQRYMFWLKGRVVKYTEYKAKHRRIMVNRVSPKDTSRRCPYCGFLSIVRYTESENKRYGVELAHCTNCKTHAVNSDFIGSLGVGRNFRRKHG